MTVDQLRDAILATPIDRGVVLRAVARLSDEVFQKAAHAAIKGDALAEFLVAQDRPIVTKTGADAITRFNVQIVNRISAMLQDDALEREIDAVIQHSIRSIILHVMGFEGDTFGSGLRICHTNGREPPIAQMIKSQVAEQIRTTFADELAQIDLQALARRTVDRAKDDIRKRFGWQLQRQIEEQLDRRADALVRELLGPFPTSIAELESD